MIAYLIITIFLTVVLISLLRKKRTVTKSYNLNCRRGNYKPQNTLERPNTTTSIVKI